MADEKKEVAAKKEVKKEDVGVAIKGKGETEGIFKGRKPKDFSHAK